MREFFERLVLGARRRSTGVFAKKSTAIIQGGSSVVFGVLTVLVMGRAPLLALLCGAEAVGQALLALENVRSLAAGDAEVVYFRGRSGLVAGAVFLVTVAARGAMSAEFLSSSWLVAGGVLMLVLFAAPLLTRAVRRDLCWGTVLVLSALMLGVAFWVGGARGAAVSQLAYAAVLVVGVFALPPWVAEALNVPVFASAVWWC